MLLAIVFVIDVQKRLPEERRVRGSMWEGSVGMGEGRLEWLVNNVVVVEYGYWDGKLATSEFRTGGVAEARAERSFCLRVRLGWWGV